MQGQKQQQNYIKAPNPEKRVLWRKSPESSIIKGIKKNIHEFRETKEKLKKSVTELQQP